jgi:hypothetical protein
MNQPAPYKQTTKVFGNMGMVTKLDPAQLQEGMFQQLNNLVSLQEGAIVTRNGFFRINSTPLTDNFGNVLDFIHVLARLATGSNAANNYRYLGSGQQIFRVSSTVNPIAGYAVATLGNGTNLNEFGAYWSMVAYRKNSSGLPYAYFATPTLMLKDVLTDTPNGNLQPLEKFGIDRPVFPMRAAIGAALPTTTSSGSCNTQLYTVINVSGSPFSISWGSGTLITINGQPYVITAVQDVNHLTIQTSAGYQNGVGFTVTFATNPGPNATITDYTYVYTFRNPITGAESNPSMFMVTGLSPVNQAVNLTISPICPAPQQPNDITQAVYVDPQIYGPNSIAIYRAGGSFADNFYRLIGYTQANTNTVTGSQVSTSGYNVALTTGAFFNINWPTGTPITINNVVYTIQQVTSTTALTLQQSAGTQTNVAYSQTFSLSTDVTFIDTMSDAAIASNPQAQFDNDPPVTSTLPIAFSASINAFVSGGTAGNMAEYTLTVNQGFAPGQTDLAEVLRPGTALSIGTGNTQEFAVLEAITGNLQIRTFFQYTHSTGETVSTGSVSNQPCSLSALAFNSLFLAGDVNNPTYLYKSKTGIPESFPVVDLEDGSPGSIEVGSPSNPIIAITEFNGQIVCLNRDNIFVVNVWNGAMTDPIISPAQRGLYGQQAWCKVDNAIWYVSYDGIYAWSGGPSTKMSEPIDPFFKGETVNQFAPVSFSTVPDGNGVSDVAFMQLSYFRNEVRFLYRDTAGNTPLLRYHTIYNRWSIDTLYVTDTYATTPLSMLFEEDTGDLLVGTIESSSGGPFQGYLNQMDMPITSTALDTTDGFTDAAQDNGHPISWFLLTNFYTLGMPSLQKQFGDIVFELQNPSTVTVNVYYDFSTTPDPIDVFVIPQAVGRRRVVLPLKSGSAQEAYAIAFKISGTTATPVTLYTITFNYLPLEQIQLGRALDWDNLGWPYDKKLQQLTIEYDTQGEAVTLNLDMSSGISPALETQTFQTVTLRSPTSTLAVGPVRNRDNFPIPNDVICKAIRLRPTPPSTNFKVWDYGFDFIKYPPDKVLFTDWEDLGYLCDKVFREILLTIDTGSVDCEVDLWLDGVERQSWYINTSTIDRDRILTTSSDIVGKSVRLVFTPAAGGKAQLFNYKYNWIVDPCAVLHWDSYETAFQYDGFKFIKQVWVEYVCESSLTVKIFRDMNQQFLSTTLPPHTYRNVERFYLPPISTSGYTNKSKVYRFTIDPCNTCSPFKLYKDGTKVEVMYLSGDQRQGYQQQPLWEKIPIDVPPGA